jgi:hypothetical protein
MEDPSGIRLKSPWKDVRLWVKKVITPESRAIDDYGFRSAIFTVGVDVEPHACATLSDDLVVEFQDGERLKIPICLNVVSETYLMPQQMALLAHLWVEGGGFRLPAKRLDCFQKV